MSTTFNYPSTLRKTIAAKLFWIGRKIQGWWNDYLSWRIEQAAIARLSSLSDYELKDLGLTRSEISSGVKGRVVQKRTPEPLISRGTSAAQT